MKRLTAVCLLLASTSARPQQMDMDAMMKWAAADLVRYHIVGVYQARTYIAADGSGQADITDRVVIDLTWKLSESTLAGQPTFQNTKTVVAGLSAANPNACLLYSRASTSTSSCWESGKESVARSSCKCKPLHANRKNHK